MTAQPAPAVADDDIASARVDVDIVGVTAQRKAAGWCQILAENRTEPSPALATRSGFYT